MYVSYNTQNLLQEERVRDLLENAQPRESQLGGRLLSLLSRLHFGRKAVSETNGARYALSQNRRLVE